MSNNLDGYLECSKVNSPNKHTSCIPLNYDLSRKPLIKRALEDPSLVLGVLEWHTELKQSHNGLGKVLEEGIIVLCVHLGVLPEALVLDELHVSGQHHEALGLDILKLLGAVPLLVSPLLLEKELVVVIGQGSGREGPGTVVAGTVSMAATEGMSTRQGDHGTVIKAHAAKDGANVAAALAGIGQTTIGSAEGDVTVGTASAVGDLRALHLLDGTNTSKNPEVGVADPGVGLLDRLEEVAGSLETSVGTVVTLGGEAHSCTVGATSSG